MPVRFVDKEEEKTLYMIQLKKDNIELQNKVSLLQHQVNERK